MTLAVSFTYEDENNLLWIRMSGVVTPDVADEYTEFMEANDDVRPGYIEVVDFTDATDFELSYQSIRRVTDVLSELKDKRGYSGTVMIAPNDFSFGIGRMVSAISEAAKIADMRVVRDKSQVYRAIEELRGK